jgi:biopolymer transport protein ExbD
MAGRINPDDDGLSELSEINVTPFIDVILVLLIIFMVAAPLATVDVAVDLPSSSAAPKPRPQEPVYLSLKADQTLYLGNEAIDTGSLPQLLDQAAKGNKDARIFLRVDRMVAYWRIMEVMNAMQKAGYPKVGLVTLDSGDGH